MKVEINPHVLGLFPHPGVVGGVQASGLLAWEAINRYCEAAGRTPRLICFGAADASGKKAGPVTSICSKAEVALRAATFREPCTHVLIWHIGLLKLLPFLSISRAKLVLFLHGIECWTSQDLLTKHLLRRVNLFLSNSDYTWERFTAASPSYSNHAHLTVPLGIGSPQNGAKSEYPDAPIALMLGRLSQSEGYKGHREVIAAWPTVLQILPNAQLWVVGDGDLKADLINQSKRAALNGSVRFWGEVSEEQKDLLLSRMRCLVLPSCGEGFGLVYLEAQRLGRPCLVSREDAGMEVVNPPEAGLAVDPHDQQGIANAICRLLSKSEEWDQWSRQAKRRYEANFTAEHFQRRLITALFQN